MHVNESLDLSCVTTMLDSRTISYLLMRSTNTTLKLTWLYVAVLICGDDEMKDPITVPENYGLEEMSDQPWRGDILSIFS
jgi:hypothetical protein